VTGGAGFIGSHLVELLVNDGFKVSVIDNLSVGKIGNLKSVLKEINFIEADIRSNDVRSCFQGVDYVIHLAALADIVPSIERPEEYLDVNVQGTIKTLENMRAHGVPRIIYAASSSCYGIPDKYPTAETCSISPEYPYALSKYLGELVVLHWIKVYGISGISLRLFNVFGNRARTKGTYGAVLGVFIGQKFANLPLTIVGDGSQTRDFVYVKDVARAFRLAALSSRTNEIYNVGSGNPVSIKYLADTLSENQVHIPKRPGEPDITHADIRKISTELGWVPQSSFLDGLTESMSDHASWQDSPAWTVEAIQKATGAWFKNLKDPEVIEK